MDELELHDRALSDYAAALDFNPENVDAYFNRARTRYYLGRLAEAIADYTEVIALRPEDAEAFNNRGLAYDALEDYASALADYDLAVALWPAFPAALNNRGAAKEAMDDVAAALADYRAALNSDQDFAVAWYNAARLYARLGEIGPCLQHLERAVALAPAFAADAAEDDHLAWVLELQELKRQRGAAN